MIFYHALDQIYGSRKKLAVLRLFIRGGGNYSGRQVALRVGMDPKTSGSILADLLEAGVLERTRVGAAYLYSLQEEHVLVSKVLRPAFEIEEKLLDDYAADFLENLETPLLSFLLFGSTVRGEEGPASDVDLFAVVASEEDRERVEEEGARVALELASRYGNTPQLIVYEHSRFRKEARKREPFVREVLRTGRVVHGLSLTELVASPRKKCV